MDRKLRIRSIPGKEIGWAGERPSTGELCFGTHDGFLYFEQGGEDRVPIGFKICSESINDVAFLGDTLAASSRLEISIAKRLNKTNFYDITQYPIGSFGAAASNFAGFLFPIGDEGVLCIGNQESMDIRRIFPILTDVDPYCYRLIRLHQDSTKEVFAIASRDAGIFGLTINRNNSTIEWKYQKLANKDIVDICSFSDSEHPFAVACLARDGYIFMKDNVLEPGGIVDIKFDEIEGTAYSIHSSGDNLFVLTDRAIHRIPLNARDFHDLSRRNSIINIISIDYLEIEAEDAYLRGDQSILIVENSIVKEYPIDQFPQLAEKKENKQGLDPQITVLKTNQHEHDQRIIDPVVTLISNSIDIINIHPENHVVNIA
jgi:hypothetical protein